MVSGEHITNDEEIAQTMSGHFTNALEVLNIKGPSMITSSKNHKEICKISAIVKKYEQHPSIIKIKEKVNIAEKFSFDSITAREIDAEMKYIDINKASSSDDVPIKVLTCCSDIVYNSFANIGKEKITCSQSVKLLGVMIDNKLNFKDHVSKTSNKASQKIHALARISNYTNKDNLKTVMEAIITIWILPACVDVSQ